MGKLNQLYHSGGTKTRNLPSRVSNKRNKRGEEVKETTIKKKLSDGTDIELIIKMCPAENRHAVSEDILLEEIIGTFQCLLLNLVGETINYKFAD